MSHLDSMRVPSRSKMIRSMGSRPAIRRLLLGPFHFGLERIQRLALDRVRLFQRGFADVTHKPLTVDVRRHDRLDDLPSAMYRSDAKPDHDLLGIGNEARRVPIH